MNVPVTIHVGDKSVETLGLIDSRAQGQFMNKKFADRLGLKVKELEAPIPVKNADGTDNKGGSIKTYTWIPIEVAGVKHDIRFLITRLENDVILRLPWLRRINPIVDWSTGEIEVKKSLISRELLPQMIRNIRERYYFLSGDVPTVYILPTSVSS
jgi:hypothetical protein